MCRDVSSNNPFAPSPSPSLSSTSASTSSYTSPSTPYSARSLSRNTSADERHSQLAGIYAARGDDGIDTFGNTGLLRCVIVASRILRGDGELTREYRRYGPTDTGRVAAQKTGVTGGAGYIYSQPTAQSVY